MAHSDDRRDDRRDSWPPTPESPRPGSLHHATTTIDDLTVALTNYSRVPSPEPPPPLTCCCGRGDCEYTKGWLAFKSKLESRLILSAEVGQALLQKYEAYVRRHESELRRSYSQDSQAETPVDHVDPRVAELVKENAVLEKRLSQALLDHEVSDSSHKAVLQELVEARASISRLAAHHARAVGLDARLMTAMRERDDFHQERDSETQRAKLAESRIVALKERTSKLQSEVRRLEHDLEQRRQHRLELSEEILHDARSRLQTLQSYQLDRGTMAEDAEVMKVLESLVADNENLKHDNAELQNLLTDTREDVRALQEEVEEHRANVPFTVGTPHSSSRLFHPVTISSSSRDQPLFHPGRRTASAEPRSRRIFEPLTPETDRRPLSPVDSLMPPDMKFGHPRPRYPSSHVSFETDDDRTHNNASPSPQKGTPHKSLFLLSQSRGVQTEDWPGLAPSPIPHSFGEHFSNSSPPDGQSQSETSSSLLDANSSHIGIVLDRIAALLTRLTQADALTLTNRLKRQNLKGADVGHLSRSTVASILNETTQLRAQFRAILEDDKLPVTCTRKDLRGLFKLFREFFSEMGQLRITMNDVILDPGIAWKVSEMALDPVKAAERERQGAKGSSWIAPLAKFFGAPSAPPDPNPARHDPTSPARATTRGRDPTPARKVAKLGPALAATTTTVNVEFSGAGVGRSVTNTSSATAPQARQDEATSGAISARVVSPPPTQASFMSIFAGAPRPADSWVVLPKDPRRGPPTTLNGEIFGRAGTLGRSTMTNVRNATRLSQNVDAVIDSRDSHGPNDDNDAVVPLFQHTLRRRGLSDSSIHSTFMTQSEEPPGLPVSGAYDETTIDAWPDRGGVLRSFGRKMQQGFKSVATSAVPSVTAEGSIPGPPTENSSPPSTAPEIESPHREPSSSRPPRITSPISLLPNMASWTAAAALDPNGGLGTYSPFLAGTPRDDIIHRPWGREAQGRDF